MRDHSMNVIVQIKQGPIDFQVREPVSPLFAGMGKTRKAIDLQITQEYFGQGRYTVFLVLIGPLILRMATIHQNRRCTGRR